MAEFSIRKRNGEVFKVLVDDEDFIEISKHNWCLSKAGYVYRRVGLGYYRQKFSYLHREIMKTPEGFVTDHINRNKLDNRKENLRTVSHKKNIENSKKRIDNTSGYKGVYWHKALSKWNAKIFHNKRSINLGYFTNIEEAIAARKAKEIELGWLTNEP